MTKLRFVFRSLFARSSEGPIVVLFAMAPACVGGELGGIAEDDRRQLGQDSGVEEANPAAAPDPMGQPGPMTDDPDVPTIEPNGPAPNPRDTLGASDAGAGMNLPDEAVSEDPALPCAAPGHVGLQRLTVSQMQYSLEDLVGFPVEIPASIPRDDRLGGYVSVPDAQLISQAFIEQHLDWTLQVAASAVDSAAPAVIICDPELQACPAEIVVTFIERAFRRPPSAEEVVHFQALLTSTEGDVAFKLTTTLAAILNAPQFLFRERQTHNPPQPAPLTGHDIATRLSYFLWDTMPDEALLRAAQAGELSEPSGIETQVRRMLTSPRIERLARSMTHQWLELGRLWQHELSPEAFPEYDAELKGAMLEETTLFLSRALREERPVSELLTARESFVNARLAELYELPGTYGEEFELADLSTGSERAGLLGHAGSLALTSSGESTSIIRRGKWVSTAVLCTEIPPPPAEIETVLPSDLPDNLTPREIVAIHREAASCSGCHMHLDPPGVLLETFDPLGRVRTHYPPPIEQPIDTATVLADGTEVQDVHEFIEHVTIGKTFTDCVADRVFPIAVGRLLRPAEGALLEQITGGALAAEVTLSQLLVQLATSDGFRCDAGEETP
jgi:hypothetical protein